MGHDFEPLSARIIEAAIAVHKALAIKALEDVHFATVRSDLNATGLRVGLLLNFNASTLVVKRIVVG